MMALWYDALMTIQRPQQWKLCEHFMAASIAAGVVIVAYVLLLYGFEEKITCIPKHCAESTGRSVTQDSGNTQTRAGTPHRSDAWTSEVRTSTDQRDASWIPPLAG